MNKPSRQRGITLVELMTVLLILGILATLMIPSFDDSVRKSRRADGQTVMLELAQWMERFYTENGRYDQDRAGNAVTTVVPAALLSSPKVSNDTFYNLTLTNLGRQTFTINAAPATAQVGDVCGTLTLTQAGVKGVSGGTSDADTCW